MLCLDMTVVINYASGLPLAHDMCFTEHLLRIYYRGHDLYLR